MNIEVVTRREDLAPLQRTWDELASEDPRDGFFRSFAWYSAWLEHIRPDAEPFVVVVRDGGGAIIGLAPLCRLSYQDLGFRLAAVAWGGREVVSGDFLDFVTGRETRPQVTAAILRYLWDSPTNWRLLVMGELVDGADSFQAVQRIGMTSGAAIRRQEERICPFIALPATFDDYLAGLGTSTRYHIRRRMRDVEKKGATVATYSTPEEIVPRLDTLVRLHLARWNRDDQPGTFGRPGFVACLKQVFQTLPPGSSCRLYELVHDGQAAASLLTFHYGRSALYYQAGWHPDSAVAGLSPGVVLMAHSIRDAIAAGLSFYEFLRGDEAYKSRWTKTYRTTVTLLLARGTVARAYLGAARLKDLVKHHARLRRAAPLAAQQCQDAQ